MPAPATVTEFLDLVRKSSVLDDKRLEAHMQKLRTAGALPAEANKLAGLLVRDGLLTTFQAEQLLQGKWRRFTIGKYRVLERLGSGGMGSVYLCEHKLMRRRVAVKVLPTAKAADPSSLGRFYREARAVAALDHANIVHAYDIDQDENLHFLVMEYVDGASLQEIIKRTGPMDPVRAAHYIRQAALGLGHAHERGLIHRDIKPANLLVDRCGTVKVLDMGLARFFNDEEDLLTKMHDENVLGTADYLAPEQAVDSHEVDIRADIYSLGATLYFMLSGRTPFGEGSVAQKLIWHQNRQPKPVTSVRADVPEGLAAVILKMMAKEPDERYQTPQEVADALSPWTQQPIPPPPDAEMPHLSPAASGAGPADPASAATLASQPAPKSGARKAWQVGPLAPAKPASSPPQGSNSPAASDMPTQTLAEIRAAVMPARDQAPARGTATLNVQPATATPGGAPTLEEGTPWDHMGEDTEAPIAQGDTAPRSRPRTGASSRRLAAQPVITSKERRRIWWVVVAVSAIFLVLMSFFVWKFILSRPAPTSAVRPSLVVTREAMGQPNAFRTLKLALASAQPGDRIILADERHEENVVVDLQSCTTRVTVEAAAGKQVVWTGSQNSAEPLLRLTNARGFQLKGKNLILDGEGLVPTLVLVSLGCPGLRLEDAQFKGFTKTAIEVTNCVGEADNPVRFESLQMTGTAKAGESAIAFDAKRDFPAYPMNDYINVSDSCRFEDLPNPIRVKHNNANSAGVKLPTPSP